MRPKLIMGIQMITLVAGGALRTLAGGVQNPPPASLQEQLTAQYTLVKLNAARKEVVQPGTVLVIQKDGIVGVPQTSAAACSSRYQDDRLDSPEAICPPAAKKDSRAFRVGEKVYALQIDVDPKQGKISFDIIACDSCNGTNPPTAFKSEVIFQFAKGYLETAGVPEIDDTVAQVFAVDTSPPQNQPRQSQEPAIQQPLPPQAAQSGSAAPLTNDDVLKMLGIKLGDSVIVAKITASLTNFDTSTDALARLKAAGASDAVLQAMIQAGAPPPAPPSAAPEAAPTSPPPASPPPCADYDACVRDGMTNLKCSNCDWFKYFQAATDLDPSKPDAWAGLGLAHLGAGYESDFVAAWDKALTLGGSIAFGVWHELSLGSETGSFTLSSQEVSFVNQKGQKLFEVRPADVTPVRAIMFEGHSAFRLKVENRNYNFDFVPVAEVCQVLLLIQCGETAVQQQTAVARYVVRTIPKLASGVFAAPK